MGRKRDREERKGEYGAGTSVCVWGGVKIQLKKKNRYLMNCREAQQISAKTDKQLHILSLDV